MASSSKMVRAWFRYAQEDLISASALWDTKNEKTWRGITFHCQQATEKAIKGFLTFKKISFLKIHIIDLLANEVEKFHPELCELLVQARDLTPYALHFRYPDSIIKDLEKSEVETALKIAKQVVQKMSELIPFDSMFEV